MRATALTSLIVGASLGLAAPAAAERITVVGEVIDTWCHLSGVMGGPDATVGSAHHACAVWCAAGGIPVGLLGDDGALYIVLKIEGAGTGDGRPSVLSIQADKVVAEGEVHRRDGLAYLIVDRVVSDLGVTRRNHAEFGVVPPFAIPDEAIAAAKARP